MKKLFKILLISLFVVLSTTLIAEGDRVVKKSTSSVILTVKIVDYNTGENLTGVKIETESGIIYTDFNGEFKVNGSNKFKISYISYKDTTLNSDNITKIIKLKQIK